METTIEINNLTIEYRPLHNISLRKTLFHKKDIINETFVALDSVSFDVHRGEILGIIGKNGSGKSTLLKTIAGIFKPDKGTIDLKGNTVSLMSLGVGFNEEVTGRENIILSGMLLGFSEQEMRKKMDQIINFAELESFIDKPVKTYSSGMHSKLAFAISANLDTDIMLIDEILSVGDIAFKKKSLEKMKSLILDKDKTVIMVSHDLNTIQNFCNRVLWLHNGVVKEIGKTQEILSKYEKFMNK